MTFPILINVLVYELFADVFIDYTCFSGERFGPWISWWFFFSICHDWDISFICIFRTWLLVIDCIRETGRCIYLATPL